MSERRRLVHGKQFDYFVCDVHGWDFDESEVDDVCPVCRGEQMERERIIKRIKTGNLWFLPLGLRDQLITFIKGDEQ